MHKFFCVSCADFWVSSILGMLACCYHVIDPLLAALAHQPSRKDHPFHPYQNQDWEGPIPYLITSHEHWKAQHNPRPPLLGADGHC